MARKSWLSGLPAVSPAIPGAARPPTRDLTLDWKSDSCGGMTALRAAYHLGSRNEMATDATSVIPTTRTMNFRQRRRTSM